MNLKLKNFIKMIIIFTSITALDLLTAPIIIVRNKNKNTSSGKSIPNLPNLSKLTTPVDFNKPQLFNYATVPVTVYMYSTSIVSNGSISTIDGSGLLNPKGIGIVIQAGASVNWLENTHAVAVYYGSNNPAMANIQTTDSFVIQPSENAWTITSLHEAQPINQITPADGTTPKDGISGVDLTKPQLYNHSPIDVTVYMYSSSLQLNGSVPSINESTLLNQNGQGITIPAGGSVNWLPNTKSVEVYYYIKDSTMSNIETSSSYIIKPSADKWLIVKSAITP